MTADTRAMVHGMWSAVAANWSDRADFLDERGAAGTKAVLDAAAICTTDRVLALADGPGGLALAVAHVAQSAVSSDVVPALGDAARARAAQRGLTNVTAEVIDIEAIAAPDASFDVVVSREGLMFAVDPSRAFTEIMRVLRRGGRLAAAVWGPPAGNPWLSIVLDAVAEVVGHPVPPPGIPGPFALADATRLRALAEASGLVDVTVDEVQIPFHAPSFEQWWEHTTALAGPLAMIVSRFDDHTLSGLLETLRARLAPYATSDGYELPGLALVVAARKR